MTDRCETTGKIMYEDRGYARRAIERIVSRGKTGRWWTKARTVLEMYRCTCCGSWHVGNAGKTVEAKR